MSEYEFIRYEVSEGVARVTIDRPEVRNALHREAHRELRQAFDEVENDPVVRVAVLTGSGDRAFCAGNDLKATAARWKAGPPPPDTEPPAPFGGITADTFRRKPIIAAVNGVALGGGLEIVLACDLAVAVSEATFGLPEPKRGLLAAAGGLHRLPRQIPPKAASGMILTGRTITAQQALSLGLVNQVVERAEFEEAVAGWVNDIVACSPVSITLSLRAMAEGGMLPLDEAIAGDRERIAELREYEDFYEGPRAFAEKRQPRWTGRRRDHAESIS